MNSPEYTELAKTLIITDTWDEFDELNDNIIKTGKYVTMKSMPTAEEKKKGKWYISRDPVPGSNPHDWFLGNKKWASIEVS